MIDISAPSEAGLDLGAVDTDVFKATNILSTQLGSLEYLPNFGVDIAYFLTEATAFQNESFKSYLVQALVDQGLNVTSVIETLETFVNDYIFEVNSNEETSEFIAR